MLKLDNSNSITRLRERTHEHQANSGGSLGLVSLGQGYSTLAWIPETEGSWALPLRHERITSWESPMSVAAFQHCPGFPPALAEKATYPHPWTGRRFHRPTFSPVGFSGPGPQTPRKVPGMAQRPKTEPQTPLSHRPKAS